MSCSFMSSLVMYPIHMIYPKRVYNMLVVSNTSPANTIVDLKAVSRVHGLKFQILKQTEGIRVNSETLKSGTDVSLRFSSNLH